MTSPIELTMKIEEYNVLRAQGIISNKEDTKLPLLCLLETHFPNTNHSQTC